MAGRPPKPTKLLELTGAFRKNPKRRKEREGEPQSTGNIGGPPEKWMIFHPNVGYQDAEKLRSIWDNCTKMWPWMEFADRDSLEHYCKLKLKEDKNIELSGAEITALLRIRSELGGTGAGRARLNVKSVSPNQKLKASAPKDPRVAFLQKKFG